MSQKKRKKNLNRQRRLAGSRPAIVLPQATKGWIDLVPRDRIPKKGVYWESTSRIGTPEVMVFTIIDEAVIKEIKRSLPEYAKTQKMIKVVLRSDLLVLS